MSQIFNFFAYYKQFDMLWGKILDKNETVVYTKLFFWMVNNIKKMPIDLVEKDFYIDFNFDKDYKDFSGLGRNTVLKAKDGLAEKGLIIFDRGGKSKGVSRVFFPLVIPTPEELDIQKYYINYYKGKDTTAVEEINNNHQFQNELNNNISQERESYDDIEITDDFSHTEKRIRIQKLFIALLEEKGIPMDTKNELYAGETASSFFGKIGVYYTNSIKEVLNELRDEEMIIDSDIKQFISNLHYVVLDKAKEKINEGKEKKATISGDILNIIEDKKKDEQEQKQKPKWRVIWDKASEKGLEQELKALNGILTRSDRYKLSDSNKEEIQNAINKIENNKKVHMEVDTKW
ncbi:hypothetical protein ACKXGF_07385 [Alkalibacillus sp. S2W]|uniref:hypothetical protein n=1 Tax=Alkalibacillus sp. S2W TaxID=3386553 RepID=UPI00398CAEAC